MEDDLCFITNVDAPRYYNFNEGSPGTADKWFNQRKTDAEPSSDDDEPMEDVVTNAGVENEGGTELPLSAIQNSGNPPIEPETKHDALVPEKCNEELPQPAQRLRPANTVSSWDHHSANVKKAYAHRMGGPPRGNGNVKRTKNALNADDQPPRKFPRTSRRVTRRSKEPLTTEEREFIKAQDEAAQAAEKRKEQAAKLGRILSRKHCGPSRSLKALTLPHEFNFKTSTRARPGVFENTTSAGTQRPYKPIALRVKEFDKTPERFKPLPCGAPNIPIFPPRQKLTLTVPQGPRLHTSGRKRNSKHPGVTDEKQQKLIPPSGATRKRKMPDDGFNSK
ncbi:hypothetical protein BSKO_00184 [Bryopsis sp. KO-2023]|nr:hypothetical protein BSKO_00184 [Bryopsis sp. KO-2023]